MDRFIYKEKREYRRVEKTPSLQIFDNIFSKVVLLVVSFFLLYNISHSVNITIQKIEILKTAREEVDSLRLKNLKLALLLDNMQSKEYLEIQARDRLNFSGEKEYVFVIPENILDDAKNKVNSILQGDEYIEERTGFEIWRDFIFLGI